ncbi:MAG TPA: DegT/DnrJ/EryC1/StrS family aminotransferase, partial [Vicinamibacterales bacterium]|nr:DegT/DnrJ/EryC1/StrS family aminotransferase [Vicinamibacterales bacterium]
FGVASRPYFSPIHLQPFYRDTLGYKPGDFPVTERVAASTLALPFSSRLSDEDVEYVAAALEEAVFAPRP